MRRADPENPPLAPVVAGPDRSGSALICLALAVVLLTNLGPIVELDIFYHLAIGDSILAGHGVPRTGIFSATRGTAPWVDGEWGFQVLVAWLYGLGGWPALVVLLALLPTLSAAFLALACLRRGLGRFATALVVGAVNLALGPLTLRPQLLTSVLLAALLWTAAPLLDGRRTRPDARLMALFALWANLHGGFPVGLVVLAVPLAVELLRRSVKLAPAASLPALGMTLALATASTSLTPYGWRPLGLSLRYAAEPRLTAFNVEWWPTVLARLPGLEILLGATIAALALAPRRPRLHDLALLLVFGAFALEAHRHHGLVALVAPFAAAPSAASALGQLGERFKGAWRSLPGWLLAVLLVASGYGLRGVPAGSPFRYDFGAVELPVAAGEFLARERPPGKLFNQYVWGGYLIHRFAPEAVVFVDGRNDLYGPDFMDDYFRVMDGRPGFEEVLDRYGVQTALLGWHPNHRRLYEVLLARGWVCVHLSRENRVPIAVLVRAGPATRSLIERFAIPLAPPG